MKSDEKFYILDYSTGRIIQKLDLMAALVTCRVLMQLPSPSFDIVDMKEKKFVTHKFQQSPEGAWNYNDWDYGKEEMRHTEEPE